MLSFEARNSFDSSHSMKLLRLATTELNTGQAQ